MENQFEYNFFSGASMTIELNDWQKTVASVAQQIYDILPDNLMIELNDLIAFKNLIKNVRFIEYKSAPGLFLGWMAANKYGFKRVQDFVTQMKKKWPKNVDPITPLHLVRYYYLWKYQY